MQTIVRVLVLLAVISVVVYLFAREITHVYALHNENEKIMREVRVLERDIEETGLKIEALKNDKRYMEKTIREELGMIKKGEKIYKFQN